MLLSLLGLVLVLWFWLRHKFGLRLMRRLGHWLGLALKLKLGLGLALLLRLEF